MGIVTLIVGLGQIGMGYDLALDPESHVYSHARAFDLHPAFDLIAGVDPAAVNRQTFSDEYARPVYADIDGALSDVNPDLVVIAGPTQFHLELVQRVLELSRPTAILCEKPLSHNLDEAQLIVQSCQDKGVQLFVNYVRRSDPGVLEVKRRLDSGLIGQPVKGVVWYTKGLVHNGSHFFNLLECWLGKIVDAKVIDAGLTTEDGDSEPDLHLSFQNGTVVFLAARDEMFSHHTVELVASNGRLRYDAGGQQIAWQAIRKDPNLTGYTRLSPDVEVIENGMDRYQWHVAAQLDNALNGRGAELCTGEAALNTLQALNNILGQDQL